MHKSECTRNCWIFGAIAGLVVMLFASGIGDRPWIAGLFLGFVTFVLFGGMLIWLVCEGRSEAYDPNAGLTPAPVAKRAAPPATVAEASVATPLAAPAPKPVSAPVEAAPSSAPAAPKAAPTEVAAPAKPKAAPRKVVKDDLKDIVGIGPKIEEALNALGVTSFAQVAAWTPTDIADISERLGRLGGRVESEDWVGQARALNEARNG